MADTPETETPKTSFLDGPASIKPALPAPRLIKNENIYPPGFGPHPMRVSGKDFSLYGLLAIISIVALSVAGFAVVSVFPDYKRQSIVYELYVDCNKQKQESTMAVKPSCEYILKKLDHNGVR